MRKKLSLIALIALMVFALIGCSKNEQATATSSAQTSQASAPAASPSQDTKAEAAPAEEEPRSYTMFMRGQYVRWLKDLKWYDVAEERTGIHVEYIEGPVDTDATFNEVDQRLASGTLPDATMLKLAQAKVYGTQGAFVDLKPYIEARAPHIQAYIDAHPDYEKLITADDGGIYAIVSEAPQLVDLIGYRADHFRKAGIDPLQVRTVEDFTNAMRTLKAYYGKDNPNYYPLSGRYSSALRFGFMFGAAAYEG